MKRYATLTGVAVAMLLVSWFSQAQPVWGADSPAGATPEVKKVRLYVPYSKLELETQQRQQIGEIQMATRAKIKQLQAEEEKQILALLKPEQLAALKQMEEAAKQKRREYSKQYRARKQAEKAAADKSAEK